MKKNGIFTLKNEVLKHADFASEWRKSRFRGLEILKFSGGRKPPDPSTGELPSAATFARTPSPKKLDPCQVLVYVLQVPIILFCELLTNKRGGSKCAQTGEGVVGGESISFLFHSFV